MKQINLIILFFLSVFNMTLTMEKESEKEKLKPIANIFKKIKSIPKLITTQFIPEQPKTSILITEKALAQITDKSYIAGQACIQAIKNDDTEQLELELLLGDVNYTHNGKSLFYIACEDEDTNYVRVPILEILLMHENIDVNSRNAQKQTPLHRACQWNLTSKVASMLKKSPQAVYYKDKNGSTPLHTSITYNKKDCIELLLSHPVSTMNQQDYNGNTPLHTACMNGQLDFVTLLIEKGANTTIQKHNQKTPLYLLFNAILDDNFTQFLTDTDEHIINKLVHAVDLNNNTQMHLCATLSLDNLHEINQFSAYLTFLESQGIDTTAQNNDGKTAFDIACQAYQKLEKLYQTEQLPYIKNALEHQKTIVQYFLPYATSKQKINSLTKKQKNKIHSKKSVRNNTITQYKDLSEAQRKCLKGIKETYLPFLIEGLSEGADINFTNEQGYPLLSLACMTPPKSMVEELLKHPINLKATHTSSGDIALHTACKADRPAIVELLLQKDPTLATIPSMDGTTPFDIAMALEDIGCLKNILKYNPQAADTINEHNETPLYIAVEKQNSKQIELFLNANNKNINHQNDNLDTVLHRACECTSYTKEICDIIKLLIIHSADTTIQNCNQETPLIKLFSDISNNEFKIVDFLLAEHPEIFETLIQTKNAHDNTQFHLCTQLQNLNDNFEQYLHLLKSHNLDIHAKNKDGKKAVDVAGELYNKLYHRYAAKRLPYFKHALDTQERIYHTFLRATALPTSCASFKQIFEPQTTGYPEFPRELTAHIMHAYYDLNIETIVAKKYKDNKKYYDDYIENKNEIREQLLTKPEPQLLWSK